MSCSEYTSLFLEAWYRRSCAREAYHTAGSTNKASAYINLHRNVCIDDVSDGKDDKVLAMALPSECTNKTTSAQQGAISTASNRSNQIRSNRLAWFGKLQQQQLSVSEDSSPAQHNTQEASSSFESESSVFQNSGVRCSTSKALGIRLLG